MNRIKKERNMAADEITLTSGQAQRLLVSLDDHKNDVIQVVMRPTGNGKRLQIVPIDEYNKDNLCDRIELNEHDTSEWNHLDHVNGTIKKRTYKIGSEHRVMAWKGDVVMLINMERQRDIMYFDTLDRSFAETGRLDTKIYI